MQTEEQLDSVKNVVLIGMPGAGKSTLGIVLAKILGYDFMDADLVIQNQCDKTLQHIIDAMGPEGFIQVENQILSQIHTQTDTVIATGGSMVLYEKAMEHLKENGVVVWLETPLSQINDRMPDDLTDRGIAAPQGMTIRQIYEQREPLYAKYADLIVASKDGEHDTAHQVEAVMRTVGMSL